MIGTAIGVFAQSVQHNRLKGLRDAFQPRPPESSDYTGLFVFFGILVAAVVMLALTRRARQRSDEPVSPKASRRMFTRALRDMGFDFKDRWILTMVARRCAVLQPSLILFSPDQLERYAGRWADELPLGAMRRWAQSRIHAISEKAFVRE